MNPEQMNLLEYQQRRVYNFESMLDSTKEKPEKILGLIADVFIGEHIKSRGWLIKEQPTDGLEKEFASWCFFVQVTPSIRDDVWNAVLEKIGRS